MILSAQIFDTFDRCERRSAFEQEYEVVTISPLGLLYKAVEESLVAVNPLEGIGFAINQACSRYDVNSGELSPLSAVRHVESMAEVIGLALREKFGQAQRIPNFRIGEHEWQSNLFEIRGELHRLVLASHLDDDSLRSYAHSWQTIGELAVVERPVNLTIVIIGHQRGGRRHSHWAKGFQHPVQKSIRFSPRKRDDGFTGNWKTFWREQSNIGPDTWLNQMRNDGVLGELIVSRRVAYRADDARMAQAKADMLALAERIPLASQESPMRRSSCDELGRGACPWQPVCYSSETVQVSALPRLYRIREMPLVEQAG